ncbi:hypothetical protein IAU60_005210 [Kwoniella sp. DSM 27419]
MQRDDEIMVALGMSNGQADSVTSPANSNAEKPSRSRDGCLTCRTRKVKCNEERPVCDKCRIKSRECAWPSGDESERRRNKKRRTNGSSTRDPTTAAAAHAGPSKPNGYHQEANEIHLMEKRSGSDQSNGGDGNHARGSGDSHSHRHSHSHDSHGHRHSFSEDRILPLPLPSAPPARDSFLLNMDSSSSASTSLIKHRLFDTLLSPSSSTPLYIDPTRLKSLRLPELRYQHTPSSTPNHSATPVARRIRGTVHVPPGFLPANAMHGKGKEKEGQLVDWLVPERLRAGMLMDPSFLEPYFPSVDERLVMRHYLSKTVHIIIAYESPIHPWNPWVAVHAPLAFKHLPGTNPAADALRAAMLAVGGVHLTYSNDPTDQARAWRITKSATMKVLRLITQVVEDKDGKRKALEQENTELVLAALLSCTIASSLAADDAWHHLLSTVLALIDQLGGAQNILRDAPRDRLSPSRFFMEQLAIRDVFGCMTTELAPSILQDAFTPWFFEAEGWSRTDKEWESVERMFGISRGIVDMIARACNLIASVRSLGRSLPESGKDLDDPTMAPLHQAAQALMAEIKVWDEAENFSPLHARTQYGNHSYRHAIKIRMWRKVYSVPSDDQRVVKSSQAIIELAAEMLACYGKITWLTWPILIAGFEIPPSHPSRVTALEMLGAFSPHACFDNRAAARMLSDYWMWHDMDGDHATSWEVARTLNQRPFLD